MAPRPGTRWAARRLGIVSFAGDLTISCATQHRRFFIDSIVTEDLPLPIAVVSLIEHWRGPVQRADFVTDYGEPGQLAVKSGLIGHPSVGFADLTPTGRLVRQQTLRLKHVQSDADYGAVPLPEGVLRLIARFSDDGFLDGRSEDTTAQIELATSLGIVSPTWPPRRLALTAKGQLLRQAARWMTPADGDVYEEEIEEIVDEEAEEPVPDVGRPLSIHGGGVPIVMRAAAVEEVPGVPRRGGKPGSKNKPKSAPVSEPAVLAPPPPPPAAPVSVRGPDAVEADITKTARAMAARFEKNEVSDAGKAAAERARKMAADIRRWTTTKR